MKFLRHPALSLVKSRWCSALLGLFLAPGVWASIPIYINQGNSIYTIPGTPPPQVDALAFLNSSGNIFEINNNTYQAGSPYYETMNTLFYTNNGTMIANAPNFLESFSLVSLDSADFAVGYKFDCRPHPKIFGRIHFIIPERFVAPPKLMGMIFLAILRSMGQALIMWKVTGSAWWRPRILSIPVRCR